MISSNARRGDRAVLALVVVAAVARDADDADRPAASARGRSVDGPIRPAFVCGSIIIRSTKSASWRIPSTLWQ